MENFEVKIGYFNPDLSRKSERFFRELKIEDIEGEIYEKNKFLFRAA